MAYSSSNGFFGRASVRGLSSAVLVLSFSLGSAACNWFGGGESSSDGGDNSTALSDAASAHLAWSLISNGLTAVVGGSNEWCTPTNTTTDANSFVTSTSDCTNTQDAAVTSTSGDIYTVKAGVTVGGSTSQATAGTVDISDDILVYGVDTTGNVTGGALGSKEIWGHCYLRLTLTLAEAASFVAGDMSVVDCTNDDFTCSIQSNDNVYACEELKALMTANL